VRLSDEEGNFGTGIRHHELDFASHPGPKLCNLRWYERWDRESIDNSRRRSRDFREPKRAFVQKYPCRGSVVYGISLTKP